MTGGDEAQVTEFDTVASWTAEVLAGVGREQAVAGACRGSGNPAALAWLAEAMELRRGQRLLDSGGGLGGPGAWVAARYGVEVVTSDPMAGAARWARRLFGLRSVAADSLALPLAGASVDAAWALGVLSTVGEKGRFLAETARVVRPGGRLGLLEYVRTGPALLGAPPGNDFVDDEGLDGLLTGAGFTVTDRAAGFPGPPASWAGATDRMVAALAGAHPGAEQLDEADMAEDRFAGLLRAGSLRAVAVVATLH